MQVKKKRLEKFKKHTTNTLSSFVNKIHNNEEVDLSKMAKAINGILYQYIGDEDRFIKSSTDEMIAKQIECLEQSLEQYRNMDDEEKDFLLSNICEEDRDERKVITSHFGQLIFRVINKEKPTYFFYQDKEEIPNDFLDGKDLEDSQPPEESSENPEVDSEE